MKDTLQYIFLLYLNRSGSSFVLNELSKSEDICVCPESDALFELLVRSHKVPPKKASAWATRIVNDYKFQTWNIGYSEVLNILLNAPDAVTGLLWLLKVYRDKHRPQAKVIVFKHSDLCYYADKFLKADPSIKFLCLYRDPRAVFISQSKAWLAPYKRHMTYSAIWFSLEYLKFVTALARIHPEKKLSLFYRNIVSFYPSCCITIASYLGLPMWETHSKGTYTASLPEALKNLHENLEQLPDESRIWQWKNSINPVQLWVIQRICKKAMNRVKIQLFKSDEKPHLGYWLQEAGAFAIDARYLIAKKVKRRIQRW